jgi:Transposase domain (DUF772)
MWVFVPRETGRIFLGSVLFMVKLPSVGSSELLERISPHVPDQLLRKLVPRHEGRGRRPAFCPAQLFRTLLLSALTPAHSFNLLSRTLHDNRSWRRFALLSHRDRVPGTRILHEFRQKLPPFIFRQINVHLLLPLLDRLGSNKSVALIDATDLRAATNAYKKTRPELTLLIAPRWAVAV